MMCGHLALLHCVSKNIPDIFDCNSWKPITRFW